MKKNKNIKKFYLHEQLPIEYRFYDCHPYIDSNPSKVHACNDCSVRALCKVTGFDWKTIYNKLFKTAKEMKAMPDSIRVITKVAKDFGFERFDNISSSSVAFMMAHPSGKYIIELEDHMFAYIDGVVYDSVNGKPLKKREIEYEFLQDAAAIYYNKDQI